MIIISKPWKEEKGEYTFAKVKLNISADTCKNWERYCAMPENRGFTQYIDAAYTENTCGEKELWFSVEKKFGDYLCIDRCDAFLLMFMHYAMATGSDIVCEGPVSANLLYGIRTEMIPHLCVGKFGIINVQAEEISIPYSSSDCGATGMSCGIDSFFSLWLHQQDYIPENFRIKYFTFFNVGAINAVFPDGISLERRNELMQQISIEKADQARKVADECGAELVFVNSNISDFYRGMLVNSAHYRNCGTAMLLSGLWNKYYYSSAGFRTDEVKFDLCDDPAYHEDMLLPWFTNGIIHFYSAGHAYPRVEKTRILADFPLAQKYLTVCDREDNCGKCNKCKRTINTLIALNKLENFDKRFDTTAIDKNITKYKRYIFIKRHQHYYDQIYEKAINNGRYSLSEKIKYTLESIPYEIIKNNPLYRKMRLKKYRSEIRTIK